jgi:UDP-N-acetylmuramate: L-alanyl-gamma-D-glutamyl-meso-diaminopimelate ligase
VLAERLAGARSAFRGTQGGAGDGVHAASPHAFDVLRGSLKVARVEWSLLGEHNQLNAPGSHCRGRACRRARAEAAACAARFRTSRAHGAARRGRRVRVYDDFAHHPTAIRTTSNGLRASRRQGAILACSSRARTR